LDLASRPEGVCISLYIHAPQGGRGVRTKIRSLLHQAHRLIGTSWGARRAQDLVNELREVLTIGLNTRESGSFAIFFGDKSVFWTKLHTVPNDLIVVSGSFHVKPLLSELSPKPFITSELMHAMSSSRLVDRLPDVAKAVAEGRVDHLYVAGSTHIWGTVDRERGVITNVAPLQQSAFDDDILDDLAQIALEHDGKVTVLPDAAMPVKRKAVAIVRWMPPNLRISSDLLAVV